MARNVTPNAVRSAGKSRVRTRSVKSDIGPES